MLAFSDEIYYDINQKGVTSMARAKKPGHFLNCKLPDDVLEKLAKYTEKTRLSKTVVVEMALREYLENKDRKDVQN